ncbi:MAG: hypothetical protein ABIJ45_13835 [Candidatus Zixiibacteriota bacterium]
MTVKYNVYVLAQIFKISYILSMIIYTDDKKFAESLFSPDLNWTVASVQNSNDSLNHLISEIYCDREYYKYCFDPLSNPFGINKDNRSIWQYLFLVKHASRSHYDILTDLCQKNADLPDGILCMADSGDKFHGFKNRAWVSTGGNIHLVAYLKPNRVIRHGVGFMVLSAVSAIQAIESVKGLNSQVGLKWVNDILIEGAKVGGVLAYSQSEGDIITGAVLGLGMNVETCPKVEPNIFVPKAACLRDFAKDSRQITRQAVWQKLVQKITHNYQLLCGNKYSILLDFYCSKSIVIGKRVEIHPDSLDAKTDEIVTGVVEQIGDSLELYLKNKKDSINKGRLVIID